MRVAVTGGAGQIAYSLLFRIAHGDLLGPDQPISLHILEIPEALKALEGVKMELDDCAFPLLKEIVVGSDAKEVFKDIDVAFLVGSKPRGPKMERKDLLEANGKIFVEQGKALNEVASRNIKVLVVGNPCNTNCLIASHHAPKIPKRNFHAMTRLDQNRARSLIAARLGCDLNAVSPITIWGNHSTTQVPDFAHAMVNGKSIKEESGWCEKVRKRGAAIIEARGKSSAASAANAAIDAMRSILFPTPQGQWYSSGIWSEGNPYGIDEQLIFSFPCRTSTSGEVEIVSGIEWDHSLEENIRASEKELQEERRLVQELL